MVDGYGYIARLSLWGGGVSTCPRCAKRGGGGKKHWFSKQGHNHNIHRLMALSATRGQGTPLAFFGGGGGGGELELLAQGNGTVPVLWKFFLGGAGGLLAQGNSICLSVNGILCWPTQKDTLNNLRTVHICDTYPIDGTHLSFNVLGQQGLQL